MRPHAGRRAGNAAHRLQHQGKGEIRHALVVGPGRDADNHAVAGRRLQIHVVVADTRPGDQLEPVGCSDHGCVHGFHGEYQRVDVPYLFHQPGLIDWGGRVPDDDFMARFTH